VRRSKIERTWLVALAQGGNIQTSIDATIGTLGRLVGAKLLRPRDQMMRQYRQHLMTLVAVKGPGGRQPPAHCVAAPIWRGYGELPNGFPRELYASIICPRRTLSAHRARKTVPPRKVNRPFKTTADSVRTPLKKYLGTPNQVGI
jgi:hypothetical protein